MADEWLRHTGVVITGSALFLERPLSAGDGQRPLFTE
jgi:hypothetical protein